MANASVVSVNDTTPTLLFSGTGNVLIRVISGTLFIGGSTVTVATGFNAASFVQLNLNSTDEIYGILFTGQGTRDVQVFSAR
jgi:hypothetical protein